MAQPLGSSSNDMEDKLAGTPSLPLAHPSRDTLVHVGNATNGAVYTVALASNDLVIEELRDELVQCSAIPLSDQILLGGPPFARLDPRRTLAHYSLPAPDKRIFLYDRRMLSTELPVVPTELQLTPAQLPAPPPPLPSESSRLLSASSQPMLQALVQYESFFTLHVVESTFLAQSGRANIQASAASVASLGVQRDAIDAAIANLDSFKTSMTKHFEPFWRDFDATSVVHERLLAELETNIAALARVQLHPALATVDRTTLLECVPIERERQWAAQCAQSHLHVRNQVEQLANVHNEIVADVAAIQATRETSNQVVQDAQMALDAMHALATQQQQITTTLQANLDRVMLQIAAMAAEVAAVTTTMVASSRAMDVCRPIDELYQQQHALVPAAQQLAKQIEAHVATLAALQTTSFTLVHTRLRQISIAQSKIRDFEHSLAMLQEALSVQKKHFYELEHIEKLPASYAACLKEIARRLQYGRTFSARIQSMAEELAQLRDDEVHHRELFLRAFGQHLPRDFVAGLAEKPSHCEFRMRPFDQNLPQIEDARDAVEDPSSSSSTDNEQQRSDASSLNAHHVLETRCVDLEARVAALTAELEQTKLRQQQQQQQQQTFFGSESGESIARSDDGSKASARGGGDSDCEFPLVLALAATAGGVDSDSSNNRALDDAALAQSTLQLEHDLQAATLADEIQERTRREQLLHDNQTTLQHSLHKLQHSNAVYRAAFMKVSTLLQLPVDRNHDSNNNSDDAMAAMMKEIETRVLALLASADAEKLLRAELAEQQQELQVRTSTDNDDAVANNFKISFRLFDVNDLALFLPTSAPGSDAQRVYLAFHLGCPHRFLSEESISSFSTNGRYPDYVVGRIVLIDEQVATEANNPYGLQFGTTFFVLTVASLHEV